MVAVLLQEYNTNVYSIHQPLARSESGAKPCTLATDVEYRPEKLKMTSCAPHSFLTKVGADFCIGMCPPGFRKSPSS